MFFPDHRTRVGTPRITDDERDTLKKRAYKLAFVDNEARPEFSFAFFRPPGWSVDAPKLTPDAEMPFPSLAHLSRKNPSIAIELMVAELQFDALPGDFLDAAFSCWDLPNYSAGPLGAGWYADRSGPLEGGAQTVAAHRVGKTMYLFVGAVREGAQAKQNELHTILATFSLKAHPEAPADFLVDDYGPHGQNAAALYEVPCDAATQAVGKGVYTQWSIDGGAVDIAFKPVSARSVEPAVLLTQVNRDVKGGSIDAETVREASLPAAAGGFFEGMVAFRIAQSADTTREVGFVIGQDAAGQHYRMSATYPARTAHSHAWCRGRFVLDHALRTLRAAG